MTELVGAAHGERTEDRATWRNGYRPRRWDTRVGELELRIPKLRRRSYFPSFLEPRRCSDQALLAVIQQAYVSGVSTRRVDQLVESLGSRVSRSEVSRICAQLDEQVEAFRRRPLEGDYPYLWLDAKSEKVRDGGRVVSKAVVIAYLQGIDSGEIIDTVHARRAPTIPVSASLRLWPTASAPLLAQRHTRRPARLAGGGPAREPPAPSGDEGHACTAPVDVHERWQGARCDDARVGRRIRSGVARDALAAGLAGAACSAVPSTAWALLRGDDVLEGARAVGVMVLPHERRTPVLLITAGTVHVGISLAWSAVITAVLPRRAEPAWTVVGALAIAALDLAVLGRRIPAIRALPQGRQWADHVAYGLTVGLVLRARRSG